MRAWRALSSRSVFASGGHPACKPPGQFKAQLSHDTRIRFVDSQRPQDARLKTSFRNDDEFYQYFIHLPKPRTFHQFTHVTPPWIQLIAEDELVCFLPKKLAENPKRIFENEQANADDVSRTLELFISRGRYLKRYEDEKRYADANIGVHALHWLLHSGAVERIDLFAEYRLMRALTHCITAQRQTHFVCEWLRIAHTPKYAESWSLADQLAWKGSALRHLLEANSYWQGLEDSLRLFLDMLQFNRSLKPNSLHFTPLKASAVHLYKNLIRHSMK